MFDIDQFVADCRTALAERGSDAIRQVVARAVSEPGDILRHLANLVAPRQPFCFARRICKVLHAVWGPRQ